MNFVTKPTAMCVFICLVASMSTEVIAQSEKEKTVPFATPGSSQVGVRNPLLEFIRHIAATDNLYDPERLFSKTMGVTNPPKPIVDPGALRSGLKNQPHWPAGIRSVDYMLVFPTPEKTPARRSLNFSLDTELNCIRLGDIVATFGNNVTKMPPLIFTHPMPGDPHAMQVKSPDLFQGNSLGAIEIDFYFGDCANSIYLRHPINFDTHVNLQKAPK